MTANDPVATPSSRRWAWAQRHPMAVGLMVFSVVYLPLAIQGIVKSDRNEILFPLPGALVLGGIFFTVSRWGATPGRGSVPGSPAAGEDVAPSDQERTLAQVAQLGILFIPALVPAVVLLSSRHAPFVRRYAAQALTIQLVLAGALAVLVTMIRASASSGPAFAVVYGLSTVIYVWSLGVSLLGTAKAANGIAWRYPLLPQLTR